MAGIKRGEAGLLEAEAHDGLCRFESVVASYFPCAPDEYGPARPCSITIAGDVPGNWRTCYSQFACGLPGVTEAGETLMKGPKDLAKLRDAVKASGYNGEKVVLIMAADYSLTAGLAPVAADLLGKLGLKVDLQQMDYGSWMQRRTSRETSDKGGWNVIMSQGTSAVTANRHSTCSSRARAETAIPAGTTIPASSP